MRRKPRFVFPFLATVLVVAADNPPWMTKRAAEWTSTDALQVLSESPWAKRSTPAILTALTAFERRDGGNIGAQGGGQGMQLDRLKEAADVFGLQDHSRPGEGLEKPKIAKLPIRWETALPIRAAEFKSNEEGAPDVDGEDYAIAVYDIPLKLASIDKMQMKDLSKELKKISTLKVEGRSDSTKEVRPSRVEVIELSGSAINVVYFFPRSIHLTVDDKRVEFDAQVGRIAVAQYFYPPEMQFQGKLEL